MCKDIQCHFGLAKLWKQPQNQSIDDSLHHITSTCTVEYYAVIYIYIFKKLKLATWVGGEIGEKWKTEQKQTEREIFQLFISFNFLKFFFFS